MTKTKKIYGAPAPDSAKSNNTDGTFSDIPALRALREQAGIHGPATAAARAATIHMGVIEDGKLRASVTLRERIDGREEKVIQVEHERELLGCLATEFSNTRLAVATPGKEEAMAQAEADKEQREEVDEELKGIGDEMKEMLEELGVLDKTDADSAGSDSQKSKEDKEAEEPASLLKQVLSKDMKGPTFKDQFKTTKDTFKDEMTEICKGLFKENSAGAVKKGIGEIVDSIPHIGVLTNALTAVFAEVKIFTQLWNIRNNEKIQRSSLSIIEIEAYNGIIAVRERKVKIHAEELVTAGVKMVGAATGVSVFINPVVSLASLAVRVMWMIKEKWAINQANVWLKEEPLEVSLERLRSTPVLGMMLPHLYFNDALTLLGIMPPGYRSSEEGDIVTRREKLAKVLKIDDKEAKGQVSDTAWLVYALRWWWKDALFEPPTEPRGQRPAPRDDSDTQSMAAAPRKKDNPWNSDYHRVLHLLIETEEHLFDQGLMLYRMNTSSPEPILEPRPVSFMQEWQAAKDLLKGTVKDFLKDIFAPCLRLFSASKPAKHGTPQADPLQEIPTLAGDDSKVIVHPDGTIETDISEDEPGGD